MSLTRTALAHRTILAALLAAGLSLTLFSSQRAGATPAPRAAGAISSTVVSLADVSHVYGTGFTAGRATVVSNQQAVQGTNVVGADGSQLVRDGRVTGYSAMFVKGSLTFVVDNVDQFSSPGGAGRDFQYFKTFYAHHFLTGAAMRAVAVGNEGLLRTAGSKGHYSASLTFLRGRYVAGVTIVVSGKRPGTSDLMKLARIEDGRIQSHG
jgi:hypothetical protein